jgi:hypothetical protein
VTGVQTCALPIFNFDDAINWVERLFHRAGRRSS